ncbi:MAG: holin family protein [Pseudomonadota bacterium]
MGVITNILTILFGSGTNVIRDTAEVFLENAETGAIRDAEMSRAALDQFAAEFAIPRQGLFDRIMDGLNRLPRPMLALGTLGLFVAAMVDPIWFAERMQGVALVPEPLWWLMGAIVSFYFGARYQTKSQAFQRSIASTMAMSAGVVRNIAALRALDEGAGQPTATPGTNPALDEWKAFNGL